MQTSKFPTTPFFIPGKKDKSLTGRRRNNTNPFHPTCTYPDRPTTLPPMKSQVPKKRKARDAKRRSKNHQAGTGQYKVGRIEVPPFTAQGNSVYFSTEDCCCYHYNCTLPTLSNSTALVPATSVWPTRSSTTVNLFVPSNLSNILRITNMPNPQTSSQTPKLWPRP